MRHLFSFLLSIFVCATLWSMEGSVNSPPTSGLQASNLLNPNISVIGWMQAETGHRVSEGEDDIPAPFEFKELEIAFQSVVDPYSRADVFVAIEDGEIDLEEAYLTWFALPFGLSARAGRMKADFGRFNRIHVPETPFADRPLVHEAFFGEEGLAGTGVSLSWHVPNPWTFLEFDAEAFTMPDADETPAFGETENRDLMYVARLSGFQDLGEAWSVSPGVSSAFGTAGDFFDDVTGSSETLRSRVVSADLTLRWKNPRWARYRSVFWQMEFLRSTHEISPLEAVHSDGWFSHAEVQFARRWRTGARLDWTEAPNDNSTHQRGGLVYLTFTPSEFCLLSLQGRQVELPDGQTERIGFLKTTFNIGPHGAHPF